MITETDDPTVAAEVRAAFDNYNSALEAGDAEALNGFFLNAATTVRFGPTENLFGYEDIAAFRSRRWKAGGVGRTLEKVMIAVLGTDVAVTSALFRVGARTLSRQTQTWARSPQGWRIAAAHVSAIEE